MDARSDSLPPCPGPRACIEPAELRSVLSNLSHELCRPLMSLRAGFDLLLSDPLRPLTEDQSLHVHTMVGVCDDLLDLTRGYLDYAGLVQGTRPLCLGKFSAGVLVREIDREFSATAARKGLGWTCTVENGDALVVTDASRCQQVLSNLVANALNFTPEGGEVEIQSRVDGGRWLVSVVDDGPGIPLEEQARVFEPFYRLAREDRTPVVGNGLGLPICRELVGQLGGELTLTSTVGQGTRITLGLPVESDEAPGSASRARPA